MNIVLRLLGLILGFILLIKGADVFVDASINIAKRLRIPGIVIGLTLVAFGTSAPEAVISVSAAAGGSNAIAIGNVIGSNMVNLLLAVGLAALISPIAVIFKEISRDYWVSVGAAALLLVLKLVFNDTIPRAGAFLLLAVFLVYMFILVRQALKNRSPENNKTADASQKNLLKSIIFAVFGAVIIVVGGQLTINNAIAIAEVLNISERMAGLTILAIGTSLPEIVTSVVAAKKGENDIAVGNILGSNIFNLLFVLGLAGLVLPLEIDTGLLIDLAILIAVSFAFLLFTRTGKRIVRGEGVAMVVMYMAYMVYLIVW